MSSLRQQIMQLRQYKTGESFTTADIVRVLGCNMPAASSSIGTMMESGVLKISHTTNRPRYGGTINHYSRVPQKMQGTIIFAKSQKHERNEWAR